MGNELFNSLFNATFNSENAFGLNENENVQANKNQYPYDIIKTDNNLFFEIPFVGSDALSNVYVSTQENLLHIQYDRKAQDLDEEYGIGAEVLHSKIARRSFDLKFKIAPKYDIERATLEADHGLIRVTIPIAKKSEKRFLKFNS